MAIDGLKTSYTDEIIARDDHVLSENPCKRIIFTED